MVVNGKNVQTSIGGCPKEERNVEAIVKHPDYYSGALYNDIALLFLNEPYNVSNLHSIINTVCLPETEQNFHNAVCRTSIWDRSGRSSIFVLFNLSLRMR